MDRQAAVTVCLLLAACRQPPFGELLLVVDTDVSVPAFASRLRVDLHRPDGTWYESREATTLGPGEWPLSFSLYTDDPAGDPAGMAVRARLRVLPADGTRDYRGEMPPGPPLFVEPAVAHDLAALCADPPLLPPHEERTLRRGAAPITASIPQGDCPGGDSAGSVAVRVEIPVDDTYRFEVVRAVPDGAAGIPGGDATLFLRRACADPDSQVACADDLDHAAGAYLPRLVVHLTPGTYYLMSGGSAVDSPADLRLRWAPAAAWEGVPPPDLPAPGPAQPRLVVDGVDRTPPSEPQPGLTIDRLVDLEVPYGRRRTARVLLSGECLGTAADLAAGTTCVDTAGERRPAAEGGATVVKGIDRGSASATGSWAGEQPIPCTVAPRVRSRGARGVELFDEEVCVPGGAFVLGAVDPVGFGDRTPSPRQVAVVAPFLLDRFEVTVGRFRQAMHDGFEPRGVVVNDGPLLGRARPERGCTLSGDAAGPAPGVDRETLPLTCVAWETARDLCRFLGGDLPGHVEWEYAATAAGRGGRKTIHPWGDEPPACERAAHDRDGGRCGSDGPPPVDAAPFATGDVTPLGVVGLGGSVAEWTQDGFRGYADPCWWQRPLRGVGCREQEAPLRSMRGGSWQDAADALPAANLLGQPPQYPVASFGVRCARPGRR